MFPSGVRSLCVSVILLFAVAAILLNASFRSHSQTPALSTKHTNVEISSHTVVEQWKHATGIRVVALIFYGRREFVSILDCYLKRNLVRNGGLLDEVLFVIRTDVRQDLVFVGELVTATPEYSKTFAANGRYGYYADAWNVVQNGVMYVKIDDDVVFVEDNTIGSIIRRKIEHPEYFLVSANLVNQPAMAWVHYHLNAIPPYLPELTPPEGFLPRTDGRYNHSPTYQIQQKPTWRASELPTWSGPAGYTVNFSMPAPFVGHRWLPAQVDIDDTPIAAVTYDPHSAAWSSWAVGAQTHYGFLENLEKEHLHKYKYDLWNYHYERLSINFICVLGDDIRSALPMPDGDEVYLTQNVTRRLRRHAVMDGMGLAVHFGFGMQMIANDWHGIHDTDALDRYRAFAEEKVCGKPWGNMMP